MPVTFQPVPLRSILSWRDDPIFPQQKLKTSIALEKEYWVMLRAAADVYPMGKALLTVNGVTGDIKKLWRVFRSYIHQAENYWLAGAVTRPESAGLLYYYSFLNLVKAYLILKGVPVTGGNETHGLTTRKNTWRGSLTTKYVFIPPSSTKQVPIFSSYYSQVFSIHPPINKLSVWKLLSYVTDISYQYQSVVKAPKPNDRIKHRIVLNNQTTSCWLILAIPKSSQIERNWPCFRSIHKEFEKIKADPLAMQVLREMFGFESLDWTLFDFYQNKAGRELPVVNNQIPRDSLIQRLTSAFGSHLAPSYDDDSFSGLLSLPIRSTRWTAMNEEIAIYATMFFVSELLRYRTEYLEEILQTNAGWILKSFVESCPLKFLRIITSRIHGHIIRMSYH
jgi:hypothetical protein